MKEDFLIKIETWHKPDLGTLENVSSSSQEPQGEVSSLCLVASPSLPWSPPCGPLLPGQEGGGLCLDLSYQHGIAVSLICKM